MAYPIQCDQVPILDLLYIIQSLLETLKMGEWDHSILIKYLITMVIENVQKVPTIRKTDITSF